MRGDKLSLLSCGEANVTTEVLCSILIPTIGRPTLDRAIESAVMQLSREQQLTSSHEIIVLIDSDAVSASDILSRYAGTATPIRAIDVHRCGKCFSCNAGIAVARGKYVSILDDDDYLLPRALDRLVAAAEQHASDVAIGGFRLVDDHGGLLAEVPANLPDDLVWFFLVGEAIGFGQCVFRRDALLRAGGFDPRTKIAEDRELLYRIALDGKIRTVEGLVVVFRRSGGDGSTFDFSKVRVAHRAIREGILDHRGVLHRLWSGVAHDHSAAGRVARQLLASTVNNIQEDRLHIAISRLWPWFLLTARHGLHGTYWRMMVARRPAK